MQDEALTGTIIGCAYKVHGTLKTGFSEKVYENALRIELMKVGLRVRQQAPIRVYYEGELVGDFYADLWVEERIILELKAVKALTVVHEVQLVNYLTATGTDIGLLINFGPSVTVKRKYRQYKPKKSS
jgi:GxxExxY protein